MGNTNPRTGVNNPNFHGRKGRSGRSASLRTVVNKLLNENNARLPKIFDKLYEMAMAGDREAGIYICDRVLGKPKASTDINLDAGEISTGVVIAMLKEIQRQKRLEFEQKQQRNPAFRAKDARI